MAKAITRYLGEMMFETEVGGQRVVTDVTPPMGGKGRAPTPPDLFAVSIGACVAAFIVQYCDREGLSSHGLVVETMFEKTEKPAALVDFVIEVALPNADCGARLAAVQRVADQCIIHETLRRFKPLEIQVRDCQAATTT